jgi:hypothetical protein
MRYGGCVTKCLRHYLLGCRNSTGRSNVGTIFHSPRKGLTDSPDKPETGCLPLSRIEAQLLQPSAGCQSDTKIPDLRQVYTQKATRSQWLRVFKVYIIKRGLRPIIRVVS